MNEAILEQISVLREMSQAELIAKYSELFDGQRMHSTNSEYLRKKIAYKIQELEHGGLSEAAKKQLEQFIQIYDPINNKLLRKIKESENSQKNFKRDKRLPIPGTIFTKIYKGTEIKVKVLDNGFEYDGSYYRSLSRLASTITGDHWNGYLFFGIQTSYGKRNKKH